MPFEDGFKPLGNVRRNLECCGSTQPSILLEADVKLPGKRGHSAKRLPTSELTIGLAPDDISRHRNSTRLEWRAASSRSTPMRNMSLRIALRCTILETSPVVPIARPLDLPSFCVVWSDLSQPHALGKKRRNPLDAGLDAADSTPKAVCELPISDCRFAIQGDRHGVEH